jgi:hypothetical protein
MIPYTQKYQLAEQIHRMLDGGAPSIDSVYDPREIELLVDQVLSMYIKKDILENMTIGEYGTKDQYVVTYTNLAVLKDEDRNLFYTVIPAKYMTLPGGRGLQSVGPMGNEFDKFIPIGYGGANFSRSRGTPLVQNNVGFWAENGKVFYNVDMSVRNISKVIMQLITTEGDVMIPLDLQAQVIDAVVNMLKPNQVPDNLNDNNAVQRQISQQ